MPEFQPSQPTTKKDRLVSALRYIQKAAALLEKYVSKGGTTPSWVDDAIVQAAANLGTGISYLQYQEKKKGGS